jgi:hypothetical protein
VDGRRFDPSGHADALYSLAAVLIFAWILGGIGVFNAGVGAFIMLAVATLLVGVAVVRRRV